MIIAILAGALLGFVLAIPPGPVGVSAVKLGLFTGRRAATHFSLGTGLLDVFFCLAAIFATSAVVSSIGNFTTDYPLVMVILQVTLVVAFMIFGFVSIRSKKTLNFEESPADKQESRIVASLKSKGPFFLGIGIALTNIANPSFLPSLMWVTMNVHSLNIMENSAANNFLFSVSFGFGNFLWLYGLVQVVLRYKHKISDNMMMRIQQFAGFTLIGFGTLLGYRLLTLTKWSEVLRFAFAF
ncbi:MAG: LysE family translocator [Candidatus Kapaibacterium sp.]